VNDEEEPIDFVIVERTCSTCKGTGRLDTSQLTPYTWALTYGSEPFGACWNCKGRCKINRYVSLERLAELLAPFLKEK